MKIRIVEGKFEIGVKFFELLGFKKDYNEIDLKKVYWKRNFIM